MKIAYIYMAFLEHIDKYIARGVCMNWLFLMWCRHGTWYSWRRHSGNLSNSETARQMEQIRRCAHIALLCVQEDPADRPSMWEVVLMLSTTTRLQTPKKPVRQYVSETRSGDLLRDTRNWYKKTITVVLRDR
jgi:hypothetical protein